MEQKHLIAIIAVIVVIGALFGASFFLSDKDVGDSTEFKIDDGNNGPDVAVPPTTITAKHQFADGTHFVAGEIELPTPCHILEHEVFVAESFPEQVTINFSMTTQAEACVQVITPARFLVQFDASERATIETTLNGNRAILNLIDADPGENLEDFDLFIKG
jgi:hypothetical protein